MTTFYPGWWPWCARCNKPVQRMIGYRDTSQPCLNIFEVQCHGKSQRTLLTDQELLLARVRGGMAFDTGQLAAGTIPGELEAP